jgi:transcriptional regulator with XRE-family HTH domain
LSKQPPLVTVFTDLGIGEELKDREFRNQFFRTERELDIPAQIKTLRKLRQMTQGQLAEKAGTKQSAVSRLERSQEANWELETLVKLAEALDARLSVVIEPYEATIARYKRQTQFSAPSAATAETESGQSPERLPPPTRPQATQDEQNNSIEKKGHGAKWN